MMEPVQHQHVPNCPNAECDDMEEEGGEKLSRYCLNCLSNYKYKTGKDEACFKLKKCVDCLICGYCSELCRKDHWASNHKQFCHIFAGKKNLVELKHDSQ